MRGKTGMGRYFLNGLVVLLCIVVSAQLFDIKNLHDEARRRDIEINRLSSTLNNLYVEENELQNSILSLRNVVSGLRSQVNNDVKDVRTEVKRLWDTTLFLGDTISNIEKRGQENDVRMSDEINGIAKSISNLASIIGPSLTKETTAKIADSSVEITSLVIFERKFGEIGMLIFKELKTNGLVVKSDQNRSLILSVHHGTPSEIIWREEVMWPEAAKSVMAQSIKVKLNDGRIIKAEVLRSWPDFDIAVYEIDVGSLPAIPLDNLTPELKVGDPVMIFGRPRGYFMLVKGSIAAMEGNNLVIDSNVLMGHSGSGVFSREGKFVGTIVSGETGTYAVSTPVWRILPLIDSVDQLSRQ